MDCSATELPLPLENGASECCITTTVQVDRAVQVSSLFSVSAMDKRKWRRKERDLNARIERLKNTVDKYKQELQKRKQECYVSAFLQVVEKAKEKNLAASILVEQVQNFAKKKPTWCEVTVRHAVVLRNLSTRAYEYVRSTDEMRVKQRLLYHKQRDASIGEVDYGVNFPKETTNEPVLANSLLCFVLNGLSGSFKIPVAYFFARNCTGRELHMLMRHVLKEVEEIGFFVVRIVTDNHKINVLAMQLLCNGSLKHCIDHPGKPNRKLFLAFDQCHLIKNVRSQFLSRDIGKGGEISANHLKSLYRMQQGSLVKPVRFLTRKHVFPTNMEKMNVQRALQVFSPPVTAAMNLLHEQAGHTCDASFAGVGPTVQFMDTVNRWFVLLDVSNCTQHIHQKNADCKQFEYAGDEQLIWLETSFLDYLADLKSTQVALSTCSDEDVSSASQLGLTPSNSLCTFTQLAAMKALHPDRYQHRRILLAIAEHGLAVPHWRRAIPRMSDQDPGAQPLVLYFGAYLVGCAVSCAALAAELLFRLKLRPRLGDISRHTES
ncbi:hypothetical protein HPB49_021014 [Dermacentor silvarum]|uniref:Uncharacterized protein n=1 Tax=Dermacentor silvarum TaxID=543639 RepID=A0ACB8CB40_DERSI|nr:hypothetical protein HPB49_021014 [Dermacentor silvarum]